MLEDIDSERRENQTKVDVDAVIVKVAPTAVRISADAGTKANRYGKYIYEDDIKVYIVSPLISADVLSPMAVTKSAIDVIPCCAIVVRQKCT
jgi:hypothetical protein